MAVYIEFEDAEKDMMNIRLLKFKDGKLEEVGDDNDIDPNASEIYAITLYNLIANGAGTINKEVFSAMQFLSDKMTEDAKDAESKDESGENL